MGLSEVLVAHCGEGMSEVEGQVSSEAEDRENASETDELDQKLLPDCAGS